MRIHGIVLFLKLVLLQVFAVLTQVDQFKYCGSVISEKYRSGEELTHSEIELKGN